MKILKTIILFLFVSFNNLYAQQVKFGIKAGLQQNQLMYAADVDESEFKQIIVGIGYQAGATATLNLTDYFVIQPAILLSSKSVKIIDDIKFDFMNIDLPLNFLFIEGGFFAGAGPNFSYGIKGESDYKGVNSDFYGEITDDQVFAMKRFEVGLSTIMGYRFKNNITINAAYVNGLANLIRNSDEVASGSATNSGFRTLSFAVGYNF